MDLNRLQQGERIVRRTPLALAVGLVAGTVTAVVVGAVIYGNGEVGSLGFWAYVFGAAVAAVTFTSALALSHRGRRSTALYGLALVLGLIGLAAIWWNAMWGFPDLTSPEGLWMWPLMVLSVAGASLAFLSARKAASR